MTVKELLIKTKDAIGPVEAEQLLCAAIGKDRSFFFAHADEELDAALNARIDAMVKERQSGRPLQYVLGTAEFMGLEFNVNEAVLIPRPETELLCEEAARVLKEKQASCGGCGSAQLSALDVCTGSGCIAVYLAYEFCGAEISASDISEEALAVAEQNSGKLLQAKCRINFVQSDLFDKIEGEFDLITANPPYIPSSVVPGLQPEVANFEPHLALDGGPKGFELPVKLVAGSAGHLKQGGVLLMEIGDDQGATVLKAAEEAGFRNCKVLKDYAGQDRILKAVK